MPNNHEISLDDAVSMTSLYRENREAVLQQQYQNNDLLSLSETFDKEVFSTFMNDDNCSFIRIYYGMSKDLKVHAIIVGANGDNEDMLPSQGNLPTAMVLENSERCPEMCPPSSVLNTD